MDLRGPVFVILGRYGDIIQLLPAMKAIYDRTGLRPAIVVSHQYADVLEGVSYVESRPVAYDWWQGIREAYAYAKAAFGESVSCPQWWNLDKESAGVIECPTGIILQSHGIGWGVDVSKWPNYSTSMWDRTGLPIEEMKTLPLVFDRRDAIREAELRARFLKPKAANLLVNFNSSSSPFAPVPELLSLPEMGLFNVVDIGRIRAHRIYDMLGLIDGAAGMITCDTSSLHLAQASPKPYFAYTMDGWTSSVPRGNCSEEVKYHAALNPDSIEKLRATLNTWHNEHSAYLSRLQSKGSRRVTKEQGRPINVGGPAMG